MWGQGDCVHKSWFVWRRGLSELGLTALCIFSDSRAVLEYFCSCGKGDTPAKTGILNTMGVTCWNSAVETRPLVDHHTHSQTGFLIDIKVQKDSNFQPDVVHFQTNWKWTLDKHDGKKT